MAKILAAVPISLRESNEFVSNFHRHSKPVRGCRFCVGVSTGDELVGVAIVGRPLARILQDGFTAEVTRTCIRDHAPKGTNSFLYARCWRAWRAMGGLRIITYTLESESGASLRGAGWRVVGEVRPRFDKGWHRDGYRMRQWRPVYGQKKLRWEQKEPA